MLTLVFAVVAFLTLIFLPVVMVRDLIRMYRTKDRTGTFSSGVAGVMMEFDRVIRPSVQHVIEVRDSDESCEDAIGGE